MPEYCSNLLKYLLWRRSFFLLLVNQYSETVLSSDVVRSLLQDLKNFTRNVSKWGTDSRAEGVWMSVFGSSNPNEVLSSITGPLRLTSSTFLSVLMPMRSPFTHCLVPSLLSGSPVLWRRPGGTSTHALPLCMWWAPRVHCTRILPLLTFFFFFFFKPFSVPI